MFVDWSNFKGPSLSVSLPMCTEIILQRLEYQGYNSMEHVDSDSIVEKEDLPEFEEEEEGNEEVSVQEKRRRLLLNVDRVVEVIARRQEQEEENDPCFERRKKNMEELQEGLRLLEEGEVSD